jgi:hypothetical protein
VLAAVSHHEHKMRGAWPTCSRSLPYCCTARGCSVRSCISDCFCGRSRACTRQVHGVNTRSMHREVFVRATSHKHQVEDGVVPHDEVPRLVDGRGHLLPPLRQPRGQHPLLRADRVHLGETGPLSQGGQAGTTRNRHPEYAIYTVWRCVRRGPGGSSKPPEPPISLSPWCAPSAAATADCWRRRRKSPRPRTWRTPRWPSPRARGLAGPRRAWRRPRVRSHRWFRNRGTNCVSESAIEWMSGSTKRQCDRAQCRPRRGSARHPPRTPAGPTRAGASASLTSAQAGNRRKGPLSALLSRTSPMQD